MNRDNVRSPARSVANQEFHRSGEIINEAAHRITRTLQDARLPRPQPVGDLPDGDGPVPRPHLGGGAQAGGRGRRASASWASTATSFTRGSATSSCSARSSSTPPISSYGEPLDYSPCLECKLCVAACPSARSAKTASSTSSPAQSTTTGSSWAASPTGCRPSRTALMPRISVHESRFRERVDVAKPVLQAQLQSGVLPCGVSGRRGRHRAVPRRP